MGLTDFLGLLETYTGHRRISIPEIVLAVVLAVSIYHRKEGGRDFGKKQKEKLQDG